MTTVQLYKKLSKLLTDARDGFITLEEAEEKIDILLEIAKQNNIEVHFDKSILRWENLFKLDDEMVDEPNDDDLDY